MKLAIIFTLKCILAGAALGLLIGGMGFACAGCHTNPQTILIPPGVVVKLAEPTTARVYVYSGGAWIKSDNPVTLPAGYYVAPPPTPTTLPIVIHH